MEDAPGLGRLVAEAAVGPAAHPADPHHDGHRRPGLQPLLNIGLPLAGVVPQLAGGVPRAYMRVLVFNKDSVLTGTHTQQLTQAALGPYDTLQISLPIAHNRGRLRHGICSHRERGRLVL